VYLKEDVFRLPCWISPLDYLDVTSELHIRLFRNAGSDFIFPLWATSIINSDFSAPPNPLHLTPHIITPTCRDLNLISLDFIVGHCQGLVQCLQFLCFRRYVALCCTLWCEQVYTSVKFGYRYRYKGGLVFGASQRSPCKVVYLDVPVLKTDRHCANAVTGVQSGACGHWNCVGWFL